MDGTLRNINIISRTIVEAPCKPPIHTKCNILPGKIYM